MNDEDLIRSVLQQVDTDANKRAETAKTESTSNVQTAALSHKTVTPFDRYCSDAIL